MKITVHMVDGSAFSFDRPDLLEGEREVPRVLRDLCNHGYVHWEVEESRCEHYPAHMIAKVVVEGIVWSDASGGGSPGQDHFRENIRRAASRRLR